MSRDVKENGEHVTMTPQSLPHTTPDGITPSDALTTTDATAPAAPPHGEDAAPPVPSIGDGQAPAAILWRPVVAQAGLMWLVTRLVYVIFTYFAVVTRYQEAALRKVQFTRLGPGVFVASWGQGDAAWFLNIARLGYSTPQDAPFFPLYPALVKLVALLLGSQYVAAGLIVANLGTLGAFVALGLLVAHESGAMSPLGGARALLAFVAFPLAFVLVAPYSDGVALAFIFAALLCARRGAWRWAALWAALAGLTQPIAIILVAPLLWELARQHGGFTPLVAQLRVALPGQIASSDGDRDAQRSSVTEASITNSTAIRYGALAVVAAPLGMALYMVFLLFRFGDPVLFFTASPVPHQPSGFLAPADSFLQARALADLALVVIAAGLTLAMTRRAPVTLTLYLLGLLLLCLSTGVLTGSDPTLTAGRYLLAAAPLFLLLGHWMERRPWLDLLVIFGGFAFQAIFAMIFLWGGWLA